MLSTEPDKASTSNHGARVRIVGFMRKMGGAAIHTWAAIFLARECEVLIESQSQSGGGRCTDSFS